MAIDSAVLPERLKKPKWLRVKLPVGKKYTELRHLHKETVGLFR